MSSTTQPTTQSTTQPTTGADPLDDLVRPPLPGPRAAARRPSRAWAAAGVAAGLAGITSIQASTAIDAVYRDGVMARDADVVVARLSELSTPILVFHTATVACALLLVVFAAGLHRRLAAATRPGSLHGPVAAGGLALVSVAGLLGSGLDTELLFGTMDPSEALVPEVATVMAHWVGTVPWLWVGAGVSGVAVAVASLRQRALPRWLGLASLVLGGLTLLLGVSPLQYMAGFTGPVWLTVVALGLLLGDRRTA